MSAILNLIDYQKIKVELSYLLSTNLVLSNQDLYKQDQIGHTNNQRRIQHFLLGHQGCCTPQFRLYQASNHYFLKSPP